MSRRGTSLSLTLVCVVTSIIVLLKIEPESGLLVIPLLLLSLFILFKFPEISFALFLMAGVYKADPRINFLQSHVDLTVIFGLLSLGSALYGIIIHRYKFILPSKQILISYFIIVLLGIGSLMYTIAPIYGFDKLMRFLTITSLAFFLPFIIMQNKLSITRFFIVLILLGLSMIFDVILHGLTTSETGFYSAFGSNYLAMGRQTGIALIIIIFYFLMTTTKKTAQLIYVSIVPLMIFGMLITGGRGPLIAFIISVFVVLAFVSALISTRILVYSRIKKEYLKILLAVIIVIVLGLLTATLYSDYFSTLYLRINSLQTLDDSSALGRLDRFQKAINVMTRFPTALTGLGIGGFSVFYASLDEKRGDYPHNIFLEIGTELGVLGLISIIVLIFYSFYTAILMIKLDYPGEKFLSITFFAIFIFMLSNSSISGDINDNRLLFTSIGLIYAYKQILIESRNIAETSS